MSSNDRYNRSNRPRQDSVPADFGYEDDIVYDDQWGTSDPAPPRSQPGMGTDGSGRPVPNRGTPTVDGTAAQIDRLRRSIRQTNRPVASNPPGQARREPTQQTSQHMPVGEDRIMQRDDSVTQNRVTPTPSSRDRRASTTFRSSTPRPVQRPPAEEPFYEDDPYVDTTYDQDPYAAFDDYEDDFSEYDAPRRPARQAASRPQVSMPTFSRPTLPPAIARADLVNDAPALGIIGVGLASLAAMAIVVANQVDSLAPSFATHVSASGILENFRGESALWNIPLMAAMFTLMNMVIAWFVSPLDRFASRFVLVGALVTQFVAWVAIFRIL